MQNLTLHGARLVLADAQAALAFPPVPATLASVEASWNADARLGCPAEFDLEMWALAASTVTAAELYGATAHPFTYADDTFTAAATDIVTNAAHGLLSGDGPFVVSNSGGALPAGLVAGTKYYAHVLDANTFKFTLTRLDALEGTNFVDITGAGTGTHTISDVQGSTDPADDTQRVYWHSHGLLGFAGDGAITLTAQKAYVQRCRHRPKTFAYAVSATISAAVSVAVVPVRDR